MRPRSLLWSALALGWLSAAGAQEPAREQGMREGSEVRAQFSPDARGRLVAIRIEAVPRAQSKE